MHLLLAINAAAGTGNTPTLGRNLAEILRNRLGREHHVKLARNAGHDAIRDTARAFAQRHRSDAVIIAGGGGGTLRAVIEGVGIGNPNQNLRLGALRMGSGNVIARQLGIAKDPIAGVEELAAQLLRNAIADCCVIGCDLNTKAKSTATVYGATLGGFGLFGRVPKALEDYHTRHPWLHQFTARSVGIERLTNVEYGLCLAGLCSRAARLPEELPEIEVQQGRGTETIRLLAGALMNFPLGALPFKPGLNLEDPALSLHLIPYRNRLQALSLVPRARALANEAKIFRITRERPVTMRVVSGKRMPFFIDEDPLEASQITLRMAGSLPFIPGKNFKPRFN
jgi:diacylglycerol kinase family enzyme